MNEYLVITWADSVPADDGLADAAQDRDGQLLAAGPVHDASELDSRSAPAGLVIARFSAEEAAKSWFEAVWWPPEQEPERPQWSRRGELPAGRVRPIREIQTSSGPRRPPVPSSPAHPRAAEPARRRRCTRPRSGSVS